MQNPGLYKNDLKKPTQVFF